MHNTAQAEPRLYTYIAEWALQPSVSGSLVLSVQCESRVKYLGITTCCPTLWLRDNATLKLYRFRWRMRTLKNRKYRTATLISAYKLEKLLKKIQVVLFTKSALVCFITDHLGERERIIITFLSSKRCIITLPSTSQLGTRCRMQAAKRPSAFICTTLLLGQAEASSSYQTHYSCYMVTGTGNKQNIIVQHTRMIIYYL